VDGRHDQEHGEHAVDEDSETEITVEGYLAASRENVRRAMENLEGDEDET
jgi:hypothetical protein